MTHIVTDHVGYDHGYDISDIPKTSETIPKSSENIPKSSETYKEEKGHICSICTRKCKNLTDLKRHVSMRHLERNSADQLQYYCYQCAEFYEKDDLIHHFQTMHMETSNTRYLMQSMYHWYC